MKLNVEIEINKPKEAVWSAITDIEHCSDMISGIIDLELINQPESGLVGLKWKETRKMFGKEASETMWITDCVENSYYLTRAENHGAVYVTKMAVADHPQGSTLTMEFSGYSETFFMKVMSALMTPFMKKSMIKLLRADLEDIKAFVEAK